MSRACIPPQGSLKTRKGKTLYFLAVAAVCCLWLAVNQAARPPRGAYRGDTRCIFEGAALVDEKGEQRGCDDLEGKIVALYFAADWCPHCRSFTPSLRQLYGSSWSEDVRVVFVSSDMSARDAESHYQSQKGGWFYLRHNDPLTSELKKKHKVWSGREVKTFGKKRRSGVPTVLVIDESGNELAFLDTERGGAASLFSFDPKAQIHHKWSDKSEL